MAAARLRDRGGVSVGFDGSGMNSRARGDPHSPTKPSHPPEPPKQLFRAKRDGHGKVRGSETGRAANPAAPAAKNTVFVGWVLLWLAWVVLSGDERE
ncbi:hypothetical protein GCM10023318_44300 [Nocardia callitridis]|uniref:Uncharacterized protein n=1 Tax=Nocardia callitridis TaxID=648753 RepID=A0ABP9KPP4_9NOCA